MQQQPAAGAGMPKACSVCSEPIKKHQGFHFGAVSCHSCRQFFRRLCQETKWATVADLKCTNTIANQGRCVIDVSTRKYCQRCRYDKCLAAGMRPELVLNEQEKDVRFGIERWHKHRKSEVTVRARYGKCQSTCELNQTHSSAESQQPSISINKITETSSMESFRNISLATTNYNWIETAVLSDQENYDDLLVSTIHRLHHQNSTNVFYSQKGLLLVNRLIALHLGEGHLDISFIKMFSQLHRFVFAVFADTISSFKELDSLDKVRLIERNSGLYFSFILAKYILADCSQEQIKWLSGKSDVYRAIFAREKRYSAKVCTRYELQEIIKNDMANVLKHIKSKSAMALLLLFYGDGLTLQNEKQVQQLYNFYMALFNKHLSRTIFEGNYQDAISSLVPLCNELKRLVDSLINPTALHVAAEFTFEEELWLKQKLHEFDAAEKSVSLREEMLNSFAPLSMGEHVGPHVLKTIAYIHKSRALQVLKTFPEFCNLSNSIKRLWMPNYYHYMALGMTLCYRGKTPFEQVSKLLRDGDLDIWNEKFHFQEGKGFRRVTGITFIDCIKLLPPAMTADFEECLARLSRLLQNYETYQLMCLVVLLTPPAQQLSSASAEIVSSLPIGNLLAVRNRFIVAIERRGYIEIEALLKGIENVQRLADIIMLM